MTDTAANTMTRGMRYTARTKGADDVGGVWESWAGRMRFVWGGGRCG